MAKPDIVRVLRVIEYVGERAAVEKQINMALHGQREGIVGVTIRAATLGNFPEILENLETANG